MWLSHVRRVGDILESVNGQSMANADHREAVRAVKESKGALTVAVRRRRHANPLLVGIVSAVNSVPHVDSTTSTAKPEEHNFSLLVTSKDSMLYATHTLYTMTSYTCIYACTCRYIIHAFVAHTTGIHSNMLILGYVVLKVCIRS